MTRTRRRPRWTAEFSRDNPGDGCPCEGCALRRAHPMEEVRPRDPGRRLTSSELEQRRMHEEHAARELAMWQILVFLPELRAALSMWLAVPLRAGLLEDGLRRFVPAITGLYSGLAPPQSLDHLMTAPRTGPPAGTVAAGNALPGHAGGAVIVP